MDDVNGVSEDIGSEVEVDAVRRTSIIDRPPKVAARVGATLLVMVVNTVVFVYVSDVVKLIDEDAPNEDPVFVSVSVITGTVAVSVRVVVWCAPGEVSIVVVITTNMVSLFKRIAIISQTTLANPQEHALTYIGM